MDHMVEYNSKWGFSNTYSESRDQLGDLERAMFMLDGQPEPDHRVNLATKFTKSVSGKNNFFEDDLFAMKWYQKWSLHVTFKRLDLVDKMNKIIAKRYPNVLPERI